MMTPREIYEYWGPDMVNNAVAELSRMPPIDRVHRAQEIFGRRFYEVLPWVDELANPDPVVTGWRRVGLAICDLAAALVADVRKLLTK